MRHRCSRLLTALLLHTAIVWADPVVPAADATTNAPAPEVRAEADPIPSDAELETSHARIGQIRIERRQIFDLSNPKEDNWLFRLADQLHARTRERVIRAQLLFRTGDLYSRRILDETARNMRENLAFMREPEIRPERYHDGIVDILVITNDVWTLQPQINFGRSGGVNTVTLDVTDDNFLGYGKYVEVGHSENVDRRTNYVTWTDPNVWGTHWQDSVQLQDNSDGKVWNLSGMLPFYSLETRFAGGGSTGDTRSVVTRYSLGNAYDYYELNWRVTDVFIGDALLVNELWTDRLLLGFRNDESVFGPAAGKPLLAPLPSDRQLAYPYVRMQWVQNDYATTRNLELISFTEDLHFGFDGSVGLGWAAPVFGADRKGLIADSELGYNWRFGPANLLLLYARLYGRAEGGRLDDAIASPNASYYLTTSDHTKFMAHLWGDFGHNLDTDHYLQIGGDTGLRGYPLRYQNGQSRAQLTVEERVYTDWYLLQLMHVGGAVFFDTGRTWGGAPIPTPQYGWLRDAGIGLRLGSGRSSFGSVIHLDLAAPLNATRSISRLQFLVSTERSF